MRFIVLAVLLGCALGASVDRVRRDNSDEDLNKRENHEMRVKRTAEPDASFEDCSFTLWANGLICYTFNADFNDDTMKETLQGVFNYYMSVSCVRFIDTSNDPDSTCEGIEAIPVTITQESSGCWAHVGCSSTQSTSIQMDTQCDAYGNGVVFHEVFHALGRFHEQSRQDRGDFIEVNWDNILSNKQGNYYRCSRELYGIGYDLQSIMHYSDRHFQNGSDNTMTVVDASLKYNQKLMGMQGKLSSLDIVTLNKMYDCYADGVDPFDCEHGGVKLYDGSCFCEDPFTGTSCENVDTTKGVLIDAQPSEGEIDSPLFPTNYPSNLDVHMVVQCSGTQRVNMTFTDFDIEDYGCGYDYFRYFLGIGDIYGTTECGTSMHGKSVFSLGNYLVFQLKTDIAYEYAGFSAVTSCID